MKLMLFFFVALTVVASQAEEFNVFEKYVEFVPQCNSTLSNQAFKDFMTKKNANLGLEELGNFLFCMNTKFLTQNENGDVNVQQFNKIVGTLVPQNKLEHLTTVCARRPEGHTATQTALFLLKCLQKEGMDFSPIMNLYE
ncbi:uncharacterized protein LOC114329539 [Diabrotica virgifera virgifera]|uniref:Uncharacterized protein LOC114329539 n=1 Tax=Diabrotica virgifera virgifera TaxID=50390 RepID=A0A6P7FN84_DIAVI|nr:uncharacterized protein LOC114329539 [Diabrotica virgifera virgifera]